MYQSLSFYPTGDPNRTLSQTFSVIKLALFFNFCQRKISFHFVGGKEC